MSTDTARPIIIVTGANGGVGYGICERLLHQLCHATPSDSLPQSFVASLPSSSSHESPGYPGLTLIMACRNAKRANTAREKLIRSLDSYVKRLKKAEGYDGYAEKFRENVEIDVVGVELAMIGTVFKAAEEIKAKYPYISHIICNAGVAPFASIDWVACIKQLCISPMAAITSPTFYLQTSGERSMDGLGWVWQCNLFAHYVLFRELQPLLSCTPFSLTPRVIWMSSLEANPEFYDPEDWQSTKTLHPYEGTKYGIDILSLALDYHAQKVEYGLEKSGKKGAEGTNITRHFVTQPGICSTNVSAAIAGPTLDIFKVLLFYLGRLFGSPHHTISPYKAAIGAVHLALASLSFISLLPRASSTQDEKPPILRRPLKYGAETGRWGEERVGIAPIKEWEDNKERAEDLLEKCERLYEQVKGEREPGVDSGSE